MFSGSSLQRQTHSFLKKEHEMTVEMQQQLVIRIVSYLRDTRQSMTAEQLKEKFKYDVPMERVCEHQSVIFDQTSRRIAYRPIVAIKFKRTLSSPSDILQLCADYPSGVLMSDVCDAYLTAKNDVQTLLDNKQLIAIDSQTKQGTEHTVLFPVDVAAVGTQVDEDIVRLWEEVPMPHTTAELEAQLRAAGHDVMSKQVQQITVEKKKRGGQRNAFASLQRGRLTNQHLAKQLKRDMSCLFKEKIPLKTVNPQNITPTIELSGNKLKLNENGVWVSTNGMVPEHVQSHITELERRLAQANAALVAERQRFDAFAHNCSRLHKGMNTPTPAPAPAPADDVAVAELKAEVADKDAEIARLQGLLEELEYRNRVLVAMCTISEGDYIQLCREAEINPREVNVGYYNYGKEGYGKGYTSASKGPSASFADRDSGYESVHARGKSPQPQRLVSGAFSPAHRDYVGR